MIRMKQLLSVLLLLILCAGHTEAVQHEAALIITLDQTDKAGDSDAFRKGYAFFQDKQYMEASELLYAYLKVNSPDQLDYEWAEFFFGLSLRKLGFSHASVDLLSHLVARKPDPKIVSYSLEMIEHVSRTLPYDRGIVTRKVLSGHEYGFVEQHLSDFIHFHQGVIDWEHGFDQWGTDHFKKITPGSYYFYKYLYQKALYSIYQDRIDDAIVLLKEVLKGPLESDDFKNDVRKTLARLLYEKGEFREADFMYGQIDKPMLDQARNLMERAWTHYRNGDNEKAMGLLYAFQAPSFQNFFTPEYYILKSFIYKSVCHYQKALSVVEEFNSHYSDSLRVIYARDKVTDNEDLLQVILNKKQINETWRFLLLLEKEREKGKQISQKDLFDYIDKIYSLQIQETVKELQDLVRKEYEDMANDLLQYEEEAHLIEYEIGLDMYQRVNQFHYREDKAFSKDDGPGMRSRVGYPFQGEFWTDELDDYNVILPDKCNQSEEWDIFFK